MNTKKPPLESKVVKKILEELRSRGGFWIKVHGSPMQIMGIPDIVGCYRGRFISFEVKRDETGEPTKIQRYMMYKIIKAGGIAVCIHSVPQAVEILEKVDGGTHQGGI